jgi:hypothetical protein
MLAIPLLLGLAAAGPLRVAALLVVPGMVLLFMARSAAMPAVVRLVDGKPSPPGYRARRAAWTAVYVIGSVTVFALAAAAADRGARTEALAVGAVTLLLGVSHAVLALLRKDRTLPGEIVGMAALAAGAPLVMVFAGHPADGRSAGLALLSLSYFVSTAVFVRAFWQLEKNRRAAVASCVVAHAALAGAVAALWFARWIPAGAALAFVPVIARAVSGLAWPPGNVRALGWREAWVAAAFAAIAVAGLLLR